MVRTKKSDCPFCNDSINDATFIETDDFLAIYSIAPVVRGHSLVVPKWHVDSVLDMTEQEYQAFFSLARRVAIILLRVFDAEGFDMALQEGAVAGQTVTHAHLHVLPRRSRDLGPDTGIWYQHILDSSQRQRLSKAQLKEMTERIRQAIGEESHADYCPD